MDCPDVCGLTALAHAGTVRLFGNADHQITRGYICAKTRRFYERLAASPTRIKTPKLKTSAGFRDISWDEAFEIMTRRLNTARDAGKPEEIAYINGTGSIGVLKLVTGGFFRRFGATVLSADLCSPCARAAQAHSFGIRTCHDPRDVLNSGSVWLWGRNIHVTNSHFVPIISEARKQGTKLYVIDPRKTAAADTADRFFQVRPDGDWALVAGMIRILIEQENYDKTFCSQKTANFDEFRKAVFGLELSSLAVVAGIPEDEIREAARLFIANPPTSIWFGWGIQHGPNAYEAVRLLDALGAITGNAGVSGGGVNHGHGEYDYFNTSIVEHEPRRSITSVELGRALEGKLNPPIKAAFVFTANPAASWPDLARVRKGFESLDLLVVADREMTETARRAHLVLPTTCFLEENDLAGSYFHNWVGRVNRIIDPPAKAKSDLEIVSTLASKLGIEMVCGDNPEDWIRKFLAGSEKYGITADGLDAGAMEASTSQLIPFSDGRFPTPSGRFEFIASMPKVEIPGSSPVLLTTHSALYANTTGRTADYEGVARAMLSPADAAGLGLSEGDRAVLESGTGGIEVEISLAESIRPGIIHIQLGGPAAGNEGINILTDGTETTEGHGPVYNAIPVRIRRPEK
jgi:anaerobic selenocysteine-containing dehydrogenase